MWQHSCCVVCRKILKCVDNNVFGKSTHIHLTKVTAIIQTDVLGEVLTFLYIYFQIGDNVYVKFGGISELLVVNCLYKLFSFVLVHLCDMITFSEKNCMLMWVGRFCWLWWIYLRTCVSLWIVVDLHAWVKFFVDLCEAIQYLCIIIKFSVVQKHKGSYT